MMTPERLKHICDLTAELDRQKAVNKKQSMLEWVLIASGFGGLMYFGYVLNHFITKYW